MPVKINVTGMFLRIVHVLLVTLFSAGAFADENEHLSNIEQLTFSQMGFDKAGEAYFSPDEKMIIFQAVPHGKSYYQMYVMRLDERVPKMVSTGRGACTCGFFHPKKKLIIFASSHESPQGHSPPPSNGRYTWDLTPYMNIYQANIDGSNLTKLTEGSAYHAECAYSPDGQQIVYASNTDGHMNLYIMNADGSCVRQLTHTKHCYNGGPFFSLDAKKIVFRADRSRSNYLQIYSIRVDGSDERKLTNNDAVNWAPYWHPGGRYIAYTRSIDSHKCYEVYLLDTKTGQEKRVTFNPSFDGLPVFSKNGTKIMWTSKRGADKKCHIFLADFHL